MVLIPYTAAGGFLAGVLMSLVVIVFLLVQLCKMLRWLYRLVRYRGNVDPEAEYYRSLDPRPACKKNDMFHPRYHRCDLCPDTYICEIRKTYLGAGLPMPDPPSYLIRPYRK